MSQLFLAVLPAQAAPPTSTACSCYCSSKDGAVQPKGFETVPFAACEKACQELKLKVVACADTAENLPSSNPRCFTRPECGSQDGQWDEAYQPPECLQGAHYCYPKAKPYTLAYTIGEKKQVLNVGDFIDTFYRYLVIAAFIAAIVVIIVGGFQYVLSAGGFGDTKKAKDRIKNGVIGFVLLLLISLILQTVNPQLTKLAPLSLPMLKRTNFTFGLPADTPGIGKGCNTDKDCVFPYKCLGAKRDSALEGILTKTAYASTAVVSVALVGAGAIVQGVKATARFIGKHYIISGFVGAGAASFNWTYEGFCAAEADRNVPIGGFCGEDKHCVSGICAKFANTAMGTVGVCTDGKLGSPCSCNNGETTCAPETGKCNDFLCVRGPDIGSGVYACSDGKQGHYCNEGFPCANGLACRDFVCASAAAGGVGAVCRTIADCAQDGAVPTFCYGSGGVNGSCGGSPSDVCHCGKLPAGGSCNSDEGCASNYCCGSETRPGCSAIKPGTCK